MPALGEPLSRADAAWLHAESPTNHFVVTSLALLDQPVALNRIRTVLKRRLHLHPRLMQVVAETPVPLLPPRWLPATGFDVDAHLHRVALPGRAGRAELEDFIGDLAGRPLDPARPLWELYLVDGPGSGGALVSRFHHCLGDGHAMVRMLLSLTDSEPDGWRRTPRAARHRRPARRGLAVTSALRAATAVMRAPEAARWTADAAGTLGRLTLLSADSATPFKRPLGLLKAVAWSDPVPLARIKEVARATEATINDVLVSAIAAGVDASLAEQGVETADLHVRAMVPVNVRAADDLAASGNQFSLVYVKLPLGPHTAYDRLLRVKVEMDRIKGSTEPAVGWLMVSAMGLLPVPLERVTAAFYASKASLVLTNVVGPRDPIYIGGSRVGAMTFWEPESGGLGVGVSIFSYAGQVIVGAIADRNLLARPASITDGFRAAFDELAGVALGS